MEDRIKQIMADVLGIDSGGIHDGFSPRDASRWDSLNHLRLMTALEEAFGIKFTMEEIGLMDRYEAIRQTVERHARPG